eukprot:202606-Chlamydomonas_euryale.AAC.1
MFPQTPFAGMHHPLQHPGVFGYGAHVRSPLAPDAPPHSPPYYAAMPASQCAYSPCFHPMFNG